MMLPPLRSDGPRYPEVKPSARVAYLESRLEQRDAVRLIVNEVPDSRVKDSEGPTVHCLSIERHGRGYRVQDVMAREDGTAMVSEFLITYKGKLYGVPGASHSTDTDATTLHRTSFPAPSGRVGPQDRYHGEVRSSLLDRLITFGIIREIEPNQGIEVRRHIFASQLKTARSEAGQTHADVDSSKKSSTRSHSLQPMIEKLTTLTMQLVRQLELGVAPQLVGGTLPSREKYTVPPDLIPE
jgi:hypothetical protein